MTMVSLGDLARSLMLQRQTAAANTRLTRLTQEVATGRHADQAAASGGDLGPLAAIEGSLARLGGWQIAARALSARLETVQASLGALDGIADSLSKTLVSAGASGKDDQVDLAARDAAEYLDAAIGILNARAGEQSVFAGTRSDRAPLIDADALLGALLPRVAGETTAAGVQAAIAAWFDDPAGFDALAYRGGPEQPAIAVGPGQSVALPVTAADPALKSLLAGLAGAALMDRGVLAGDPAGRRDLATASGEALLTNAAERTMLAARIGVAQGRLAQTQTRNTAEETALGIARSGVVGADPYASAAELEATRTQLETLYTLTARLSGLSLIGTLR